MATTRQKKAFTFLSENIGNPKPIPLGEVLIQAGYSIQTAKTPTLVTKSKGFQELLEEHLPDDLLQKTHLEVLKTTRIEHMVFPIYVEPTDPEDDIPLEGDIPEEVLKQLKKKDKRVTKGESLTDDDIIDMLAEVNCKVRKIVHGDQARHVYYWVADSKARLDAVKLAYMVKGQLTKNDRVPDPGGNTYNTFIGNNTINPNAPKAKELAEETIKILMEKTKRPPVA